jgi:hypothetical protein
LNHTRKISEEGLLRFINTGDGELPDNWAIGEIG